jgi:uncharacterized protein YndB with AHSA1/START domain
MSTNRANPTCITAVGGTPFIEVIRDFDAPRELVFRASTDPDLVAQWLGPRDLRMRVIEFDAREGGRYRYLHTAADGTDYAFRGVFHTVTEALIIQTFEFEGVPDVVSLEARSLHDLGGRTRLQQNAVFPSVAARDQAIASGMERGITESMDRLGELLGSPARQRWPGSGR